MKLTGLFGLLENDDGYRSLRNALINGNRQAAAIIDAARPYCTAALYESVAAPMLVVTARPERARRLTEQINTWLGRNTAVYLPEPEALPYQRLQQDAGSEADRVAALSLLATSARNLNPPLIIASAVSLAYTVPSPDKFSRNIYVKSGSEYELEVFLQQLDSLGYRHENLVTSPGQYARRGGIADIFPPTANHPVRLEFFGNILESLREFDSVTQRSRASMEELFIGPASEYLAVDDDVLPDFAELAPLSASTRAAIGGDIERMREGQHPDFLQFYLPYFNHACALEYLPDNTALLLEDRTAIGAALEELHEEAENIRRDRLTRKELPENYPRPYFTDVEMESFLSSHGYAEICDWDEADIPRAGFQPAANFAGQLPLFLDRIRQLLSERNRVIIVSHQAGRLSELLEETDILAAPQQEITAPSKPGTLQLLEGSLESGWTLGDNVRLFSDAEIFGFVKQRRGTERRGGTQVRAPEWFNPGDYVVHVDHGIGRFSGITTLKSGRRDGEYLLLEYAEGGKLYVPTDQINRVELYIGSGEAMPRLSRLHTGEWSRLKERAAEAAEAVAADLLELYAARQANPGHAFNQDNTWQREMEAAFPYEETPDQHEVARRIKEDMESELPMDRLVCGDAGYGKTEMAIRAAFKAVMDGRQVAFLVPTTVLAEQHYQTLKERFAPFPVNVEVLSRFRSAAAQSAIVSGLQLGTVDICIGTHRLLQKDIAFKKLGLVIIDEEQRFGVGHKEFLKKLRRDTDVLTLSATPIPRTLHMALVGARDMSNIMTPPEQRQAVRTYVAGNDNSLVREAVLRELERGGQVFFVHNRVSSINYVAEKLRMLVPEAVIDVGHGQMSEDKLEEVMTRFSNMQCDVLVCTTIIESGLDIPNANTLIVNDADRFGLTQLYQLRGRVGRGANLAYAYFLYESGKKLSETARKRLRTIFETTELGSGFNIAMRDLEIRGAGNILGLRQSGHISAIGYNLYVKMLAEAVGRQKGETAAVPDITAAIAEPSINLPLRAFIPEYYIDDLDTRLTLYHRLPLLESDEAVADFTLELRDRFGEPPNEVKNLLYAMTVKRLARRAAIDAITVERGYIVLRRQGGLSFDKPALAALAGDGVNIGLKQVRLDYRKLRGKWPKRLVEILELSDFKV